jgi:DNA polymerase-3 subunit delta
VVAACETLPVFAERRLVVVRSLDLKAAAGHAGFVAYLGRPNPSTVLLLSASPSAPRSRDDGDDEGARPAPGKGKVTLKQLLQLLPSREEFPPLRAEGALDFARQAARARGVEIAPDAARELVDRVGVDASRLDDEVEKAVLYAAGRRRIEVADVDALARRSRGHTMFELTDAIAAGDREAVLRHLGALHEDGAEPVALVGMVGWHLRRTLRGAARVETGAGAGELQRALGIHFRVAERFALSCRKLGTLGAARAIRALRLADRKLKSTPAAPRLVLERALLDLLEGGGRSA